jgi:hypothetical protein
VPHRLPVDAGRLHRNVRAVRLSQPVAERQKFRRGGPPAADLMPYPSTLLHPQASHPGAMWTSNPAQR